MTAVTSNGSFFDLDHEEERLPVRTRDPELREDVQKVRNHLERHLSGVMDLRYQIP